jgi:YidC/Oxa1 family membrane protein insertase
MLIQIPVFIALFYVLRSAIELRFAPFLWVRDLSQPENILAGTLPFGLGLNILPLIMTVLQWYQQRLTPATGDPSQQKMMLFMPWLMLIFFYNFAAGLVLYWSTNTALMVVQQMTQRYRAGHRPAAKA